MTLETGHQIQNNVEHVHSDSIRFVALDGRTMFEIRVNDETSIEILGVEICRVNKELHGCALQIEPKVTNSIIIRSMPFDR